MKVKEQLKNIMKIGAIALTLYACGDINGALVNYKKPEKKPISINYAPIIQSTPELEILINKGYPDYDAVNKIYKYNNAIYKYDVNAVDLNGDLINYYLTKSPQGMIINSETGEIEFPLKFKDLGKHEINVIADDGNSKTEQNFTLNVIYHYSPNAIYPYIDDPGTVIREYDLIKGNDEIVLLCEKPCSFSEDYFNKKWQGINLGYNELVNFTGIEPYYTLKPIEMHLEEDTRCIFRGDPAYFDTITKNYGSAQSQGFICSFTGDIGYDPALLEDQRVIVHEMVHALQNTRIVIPGFFVFKEPQASLVADIVVGDAPGYIAIKSYCDETLNVYPYKVFYDLCKLCNYNYNKEPLFWLRASTNSISSIEELAQTFSVSEITFCTQQEIENIFINNKFYQCSDGWDNNSNGLVDMNDIDYCTGPTDESEFN